MVLKCPGGERIDGSKVMCVKSAGFAVMVFWGGFVTKFAEFKTEKEAEAEADRITEELGWE
jgi:hypothetical protein